MNTPILSHFRKNDPRIARLLETIPLEELSPVSRSLYFRELCEVIINQQLSERVGDVIFRRFVQLFGRKTVRAKTLLALPESAVRGAGMSWSKVRFLYAFAREVDTGALQLSRLYDLPDEEVIVVLTGVHGIGRWTAEMFLMFALARPDVFSYGDLGLRRAIQKVYNKKTEPTNAQMERLSKRWSPYRTYAARVLWRYNDANK